MMAVGALLIYLAIAREYEPVLLLPIGIGCIIGNLPFQRWSIPPNEACLRCLRRLRSMWAPSAADLHRRRGNDGFPPLLAQPLFALMGAAGQFGIFGTLALAVLLGFPMNEAASIGIIGAIDGPTSVYVANQLAPHMLGVISVVAYSTPEPGADHTTAHNALVDDA